MNTASDLSRAACFSIAPCGLFLYCLMTTASLMFHDGCFSTVPRQPPLLFHNNYFSILCHYGYLSTVPCRLPFYCPTSTNSPLSHEDCFYCPKTATYTVAQRVPLYCSMTATSLLFHVDFLYCPMTTASVPSHNDCLYCLTSTAFLLLRRSCLQSSLAVPKKKNLLSHSQHFHRTGIIIAGQSTPPLDLEMAGPPPHEPHRHPGTHPHLGSPPHPASTDAYKICIVRLAPYIDELLTANVLSRSLKFYGLSILDNVAHLPGRPSIFVCRATPRPIPANRDDAEDCRN